MTEPLVVDSLGKSCPLPVIELAKAVRTVAVGAEVLLLADDPGAKVDIPVWCRIKRQQLVEVSQDDDAWSFLVRRAQ
ncbi:MAG: sulfurtransferase TusA family protein [Egibacteraceae bacterium]